MDVLSWNKSIAEEIPETTNPISARTGCRSNLNHHMIDNDRLAAIDKHME